MFVDHVSRDEMLLNNLFQHGWIAGAIPGTFGVHHGDGAIGTNPQTIGLGAENAPLLTQAEFFQTLFEITPGHQRPFPVTAFRFGLIATEE